MLLQRGTTVNGNIIYLFLQTLLEELLIERLYTAGIILSSSPNLPAPRPDKRSC